jgi:hypothetical protein
MLRHLVLIQNDKIRQRVRGFLTDIYGTSASEYPGDFIEASSMQINRDGTAFIITDIPRAVAPEEHLAAVAGLAHGDAKVIVISKSVKAVCQSASAHKFVVIPEDFSNALLANRLHTN